MRKTPLGVAGTLLACAAAVSPAQTSPFVDAKVDQALVNEISGDLAFATIRVTTQWHKPSGSEGFYAAAHEIEKRARAAGLQDVRWIDQVADNPNWTCRSAEAWLLDGAKETKIATGSSMPARVDSMFSILTSA